MNTFRCLLLTVALGFAGCTAMKVVPVDQKSGHYPTNIKAQVVESKPFDIDSRKGLILIPNSDFVQGEITNIGYFNKVMTADELEKTIVRQNLSDKVASVHDAIGISNAAKNYQPFLWFHTKTRGSGTDAFSQFILTDPLTMDDLLVAETHLDYLWTGVNDQNNWYPMFNALIDYIQANSKTYKFPARPQ